jgi:hypothetical protein
MLRFSLFHTPVKISIKVLPILLLVWGAVTWAGLAWHPGRSLGQALLIGLVTSLLLLLVEYGHPVAHIFSARHAGAPMDELVIAADMPRTLYRDNDVAPAAHRMRALGGPLYNLAGLLLSLALWLIAPLNSLAGEWAGWSAAGHGLLLAMSLVPVPMVDGGAILKWTLVAGGKAEAEAEALVRRVDWILGSLLVLAGIGMAFTRWWTFGWVGMGAGLIILAIAAARIH